MAPKQVSQENGVKKAMWVYPETDGANPPERWGHSACFFEGMLYIFGGCCGGLHFSDVLTLDLKTMSWSSLVSTGHQPGTRDSHSAVLVGHRMIIFGGTNGSKKINDVYILDLKTHAWSHPSVKGDPPAPRESHSATLVGEKVVIFGGSGEGDGNYLNDVHILHLDSMEWTSPQVKGDLPACRDSHTAVAIGNQLVVYGGDCGDRYLGELDILDLQTLTWTKLQMVGNIQPGVRAGHAAVTVGNKMYVFGGVGDRAYYNDVWMLDVNSRTWSPLEVAGSQPQGRFSHVAVLADNDISIYGGCGEDERPLNEFMVLCLQPDQLGEDSPFKKWAKDPNGLLCQIGHGGLKKGADAGVHENGACCPEVKIEECTKEDRRLIDLMGGNSGHVCKWKEEFMKRAKRNCLDLTAEPRVSLSQTSCCPLSILNLKEADSCHSPGLSTVSNAGSSKKDSYSVLQRRIRSRKLPLPYIERLIAQPPEINHPELKRRKTSHLRNKCEGMDSEPDDPSPSISQHSSPSQSDHEQQQQMSQNPHATPTNSKPSQPPQFAMFLPHQPPYKHQQAQHYVHQTQQHHPHQTYLLPQSFTSDQQSPKGGDHMLRIPTFQLQVRLPAHQTINLPLCQAAQLKPVSIEQSVQDSTVKAILQQRQPKGSANGDRPQQRHTHCRNTCLPNLVGSEVRGLVDGAFDSGYLMTAHLNGQVFRGVLIPRCAANGFDEVNGPASVQNRANPNMSPPIQTAFIIPTTVAQQSSSNGTLIGYPIFPGFHLTNPLQTAGATRICVAPNYSSEVTNAKKLPHTTNVSCQSGVTEMQKTSEFRQIAALQIPTAGAHKTTDTQSENIHVQTGSTQEQAEMAGSMPAAIAGQGGRWVWQPVVPPTTSYTIPWTYQPTTGSSTDNIQFFAMPQFPGVAFAPTHAVNELQPSIRATSGTTTSQIGQNSGRDSPADVQAAVTLSLAAPGLSTQAVSDKKP